MAPIRFTYQTALAYEPGVTRRDPSPVIRDGESYYVWYSKAALDESGYYATLWYATSPDGHTWHERGQALPAGQPGAWDDHAVFTPTIFRWQRKLYLIYTAVPAPFTNDNGGPRGTPTALGLAVADHPAGPWRRVGGGPILKPSDDPQATDSHRIDDACVIIRNQQIWLYYKGRRQGRSPGETKMHLAIADRPAGPYRKHPGNPVLDSGHEVCVWPHESGVACLVSGVGPQRHTLQLSHDGIDFCNLAPATPPSAPGPYREDDFVDAAAFNLHWGLCHGFEFDRPNLLRFDAAIPASLFHRPPA